MIKAMITTPQKGSPGRCKAWGSPNGYRFGKGCKFAHDELPDKADRCWGCSSSHHRKADYPYRPDVPYGTTGGGDGREPDGGGAKGKGKGKGKKGDKSNTCQQHHGERHGDAYQKPAGEEQQKSNKTDDKEGVSVKKIEK